MKTETTASSKREIRGSKRANRLAALSKAVWAFFVMLQVAAAGLMFLILFYLSLSILGNLFGSRYVLKEWREFLGQWLGPAAWLLVGFLAARLMSQLSLDLMVRFRKVRCPDCHTLLASSAEELDPNKSLVCPECGAKL